MTDLSDQTVKDLRKLAKKAGITGYSRMSRDELEAALAPPPPIDISIYEARDRMRNAKLQEQFAERRFRSAQSINDTHQRQAAVEAARAELEAARNNATAAYEAFHEIKRAQAAKQ